MPSGLKRLKKLLYYSAMLRGPPLGVASPHALSFLKSACRVDSHGCLLVSKRMLQPMIPLWNRQASMHGKLQTWIRNQPEVSPGWCNFTVFFLCLRRAGLELSEEEMLRIQDWLQRSCDSFCPVESFEKVETPRSHAHADARSRSPASVSVSGGSVFSDFATASGGSTSGTSQIPTRSRSSCSLSEDGGRVSKETAQNLQISVMRKIISSLQMDLNEKDQKLRQTQQKLKRSEERNIELQEQLDNAAAKRLKRLAIERHADRRNARLGKIVVEGDSTGWLTPEGTLSLAIRRNLSNIATSDIGLTLMMDLSRWTVARAEVRAGACLLSSARCFWKEWMDSVLEGSSHSSQHYSLTVIAYRQDATNSSVWNRCKLTALELQASFIHSLVRHEDGDFDSECNFNFNRLKRLADILPVLSGSGKATVLLAEKMLSSLGCPTWRDFLHSNAAATELHGPSGKDAAGSKPASLFGPLPRLGRVIPLGESSKFGFCVWNIHIGRLIDCKTRQLDADVNAVLHST